MFRNFRPQSFRGLTGLPAREPSLPAKRHACEENHWSLISRCDAAYALVLLWALAGIGIKHAAVPAVADPTWVSFSLVAIGLAGAFLWQRRKA